MENIDNNNTQATEVPDGAQHQENNAAPVENKEKMFSQSELDSIIE